MPKEKANPEPGAETDLWHVKDGKFTAFGAEIDLAEFGVRPPEPDEKDEEPDKPGSEEEKPDEKEPEEEKEEAKPEETPKEEAKPAEEPPKEEEKAAEPDIPKPIEYKIKYRGEEKVLNLTTEQLIARLQMAEDYTVKTEELAGKRREIEPYEHVLKTQAFKEWLDEQVRENPELAPKAPPPPSPEDVFAYRVKTQEPNYEEVRSAMREWAVASLPEYEQNILATNYRVFNETFDRFAKLVRESKTANPVAPEVKPASAPVDPKTREKLIQAKEVHKENAKVEKPGVATEEDAAQTRFNKHVKELQKVLKTGSPSERNEAAVLLLQYQMEATQQPR